MFCRKSRSYDHRRLLLQIIGTVKYLGAKIMLTGVYRVMKHDSKHVFLGSGTKVFQIIVCFQFYYKNGAISFYIKLDNSFLRNDEVL